MQSLRNKHRILLRQTCLYSLKVKVKTWVDRQVMCNNQPLYCGHFLDHRNFHWCTLWWSICILRVHGYYITGSFQWFHEKYFYSILCLLSTWTVVLFVDSNIPTHPTHPIWIICLFTDREYSIVQIILLCTLSVIATGGWFSQQWRL